MFLIITTYSKLFLLIENNSPADIPPEPPVERPRTRKRQQKQTTESPARKRGRQQHHQTQQQLQPSQQQTSSTSDAESLPITKSHNASQQSTDLVVSPAAKSERPDASMCLKVWMASVAQFYIHIYKW